MYSIQNVEVKVRGYRSLCRGVSLALLLFYKLT